MYSVSNSQVFFMRTILVQSFDYPGAKVGLVLMRFSMLQINRSETSASKADTFADMKRIGSGHSE